MSSQITDERIKIEESAARKIIGELPEYCTQEGTRVIFLENQIQIISQEGYFTTFRLPLDFVEELPRRIGGILR